MQIQIMASPTIFSSIMVARPRVASKLLASATITMSLHRRFLIGAIQPPRAPRKIRIRTITSRRKDTLRTRC